MERQKSFYGATSADGVIVTAFTRYSRRWVGLVARFISFLFSSASFFILIFIFIIVAIQLRPKHLGLSVVEKLVLLI